jgi:hypothetical protein
VKDIILEIRKGSLRWLGHVKRMSEESTFKRVFKNTLEGKRFLESQETDGQLTLKIIRRKWVFEAGEE